MKYYVTYWNITGNSFGFASSLVNFNKIKKFKHIQKLQEDIEKELNLDKVIILDWKKIK
jgi:hypothetical protein